MVERRFQVILQADGQARPRLPFVAREQPQLVVRDQRIAAAAIVA